MNYAAVFLLVLLLVVAANRKQAERKPASPVTDRPHLTWRNHQKSDREYWSAFREGMDLEFRDDRGSSEWWADWEANLKRRVDSKLRR